MDFKGLNEFLEDSTKRIEPIVEELLLSYVDEKNKKAVRYQILTGGKRLRPALALVVCYMLGGKTEDVLYPAASLEILHNYSLIIDDIVDKSPLRRKEPTCWFKLGKSTAECISIDYSAAIFQGANRSKKPVEVSELLAKTMKVLVDGEILDILFEQSGRSNEPYIKENRYDKVTDEDYFKMVSQKTAALVQASCEVGALTAGAKEKDLEKIREYGLNLGMAFQIQDDILDIFGSQKSFGKRKGQDIAEGKLGNIVILFACREFSPQDKKNFLEIIKKNNVNNREIKEIIEKIKKTNALSLSSDKAREFIDKAKKSLEVLPQNKWNEILNEIADFVIKREK
jgi:geranylgeranyl diphosphate synthase, type I